MERRQNSIVPLSSVDIHRKEGRPFYISVFIEKYLVFLQPGDYLAAVGRIDIDDTFHQCGSELMAPTVGTDVETRSYNFYLVRFCMYIEWDILVFGYFKVGLSVQFHISFVASEVGGIFHGGLGVQPYACSIGEDNLGPLSGRHSDCLQLHLLVI